MHAFAGIFLLLTSTLGFDAPVDSSGPLRIAIEGPGALTSREAEHILVLDNREDAPLAISTRVEGIDGWTAAVDPPSTFTLRGGSVKRLPISVRLPERVYDAYYPLHAYVDAVGASETYQTHAVKIVSVNLPVRPQSGAGLPWRAVELQPGSPFALWRSPLRRPVVSLNGEEPFALPVGWEGTEPRTRMDARYGDTIQLDRGQEGIRMHPPWWLGCAGASWTAYRLRIPENLPARLTFDYGISGHMANEPPSDGVTFRVRVANGDATPETPGTLLFEKHTASQTWTPAEVDLSAYAGQEIVLRLEVHPGPKNDTTCDRAAWGRPTVVCGVASGEENAPLEALGDLRQVGVLAKPGDPARFDVGLRPTPDGRPGRAIVIMGGGTVRATEGLEITVGGDRLDSPDGVSTILETTETKLPDGLQYDYRFEHLTFGQATLRVSYRVLEGRLSISVSLPDRPADTPWRALRIDSVALGPWHAKIDRIYAGVGNVLVNPEAFTLPFDGHQMATSFVGYDFQNGHSLIQAVDVPPTNFLHDPESRRASFNTAHEQTVTLIPCTSVWEGVKVWRQVHGGPAASGYDTLAGRFVFDLWGGRYAQGRDALEQAFAYGLTDSLVVWHAWQRWGYDYRLPDIWPPNAQLGSQAELQELVRACKERGVLFAPHDNYIDIYPDASSFSYENIAFQAEGSPMLAWHNQGRDAQSYRWRPDKVEPHLRENLRLIGGGVAPTAYFIDVWSSARPYAYWSQDGRYFDHVYSRDEWGRQFAWIRDYLGGAPQISESGHDQLVGWLDGAQTNHLRVDPDLDVFVWKVRCEDHERIPWIDMAHHARFALHGAGYSPRYSDGLDPLHHGIYSDDYITTEVLTGHPPMVADAFSRDVVRKYWLLHGLSRALAGRNIEAVEFDAGDIHRQRVSWEGGGEVWVNRGKSDWNVAGHCLPQYGFFANLPGDGVAAAIERQDGIIVEWSREGNRRYTNGRQPGAQSERVTATVESIGTVAEGVLPVRLHWKVHGPIRQDVQIFVHVVDEAGEIVMQGDHAPDPATSAWRDEAWTDARIALLPDLQPGVRYGVRVGMYDPTLGRFPYVAGDLDATQRVKLGTLTFTKEGAEWTPPESGANPAPARLNLESEPVDFGGIRTAGGCLVEDLGEGVRVTPLPDSDPFDVLLDFGPAKPGGNGSTRVKVLDSAGAQAGTGVAHHADGRAKLRCSPGDFAYLIVPD